MYTLLKSLTVQRIFGEQLPSIAISLAIAEVFYKFHSFLLEAVAFLVTWLVIDWLIQAAKSAYRSTSMRRGER